MFTRTTAINKILAMKGRKKIIQGGTWAGKTYGILPVKINMATRGNPGDVYTVVAETIPALKGGAIKDFKNIMRDTGRWMDNRWNATELHYTFGSGVKFEFKSFDSVGKAQAAGKRTKLFINEGPYIDYEIADALIGRTTEDVFIDFNPTSEFWAHTEIMSNKDAEFLLLKYTDNEALPATILDELMMKLDKAYINPQADHNDKNNIKSEYWRNWCRVYIDGEIGSLQGTVFNFTAIKAMPEGATLVAYGLDWGYTNDPTAVVAVWRKGNDLYLDELVYQTGLTNSEIIAKLKTLSIDHYKDIIADSAEPKSIQDLYQGGFKRIFPASKGPDSIKNSIDTLQGFRLFITEGSTNLIKEFRNYCWTKDKTGKQSNVPIDAYNHGIDAIRYVALNKLKKESPIILD